MSTDQLGRALRDLGLGGGFVPLVGGLRLPACVAAELARAPLTASRDPPDLRPLRPPRLVSELGARVAARATT